MRKLFLSILSAALILSLAACGGTQGETDSPAGSPSALTDSPAPEPTPGAPVIPGTYEAVSLYQTPAYQLNENGSYDAGEEKGTYTSYTDGSITIKPKEESQTKTLTAYGVYYHTSGAFSEDTEYGMAPTFDSSGRSSQSFETTAASTTVKLELHEDGSFVFSTSSKSPVYFRGTDVVAYEGTYTLENEILNLNWNGADYPMLLLDGKLYYLVYTKRTDENSAAIEASRAALLEAEETAIQGRWWTQADDDLAAEITAQLLGTWEYKEDGQYGLSYRLTVSEETFSVRIELLGHPTTNSGPYIICKDVILIHYTGGTQGHVAIPYVYEDGVLTLYPLNALTEEETSDPGMQFVTDEARANGPRFTKTA